MLISLFLKRTLPCSLFSIYNCCAGFPWRGSGHGLLQGSPVREPLPAVFSCFCNRCTTGHGWAHQWSCWSWRSCSPRRTHAAVGEKCEEAGAAETSCHGLTPLSPSPCATREEGEGWRRWEWRKKVEPGKKGEAGGGFLIFVFHHPSLFYLAIN